jgi:hypothetical protein
MPELGVAPTLHHKEITLYRRYGSHGNQPATFSARSSFGPNWQHPRYGLYAACRHV